MYQLLLGPFSQYTYGKYSLQHRFPLQNATRVTKISSEGIPDMVPDLTTLLYFRKLDLSGFYSGTDSQTIPENQMTI